MRRLDRADGRHPVRAALIVGSVLALAGCFTGERPTLTPAPETAEDAATDAVLERLQNAGNASFTAEYSIFTPTGTQANAVVVQQGAGRRAVTIGDHRFVEDGEVSRTCDLTAGTCADGIDTAVVSDLAVTADFYDLSPATRLRRDVEQRVGTTQGTAETIAGEAATCVTIPIAQTAARYCALDAGPLASQRTTDVTIELLSYRPSADDTMFTLPTG